MVDAAEPPGDFGRCQGDTTARMTVSHDHEHGAAVARRSVRRAVHCPPVRLTTAARGCRALPRRPALTQGRSLAIRKPTLMSRNPTGFLTRAAGRLARGRLSQEPPRITRWRHEGPGATAEPSEGALS